MSRIVVFLPRFLRVPAEHCFLFGPRGTGKSVWTAQAFPQALRVDLLDGDVFRMLSGRPERLRELIGGQPRASQVIIDEVQKAPALLDTVHKLIEQKPGVQFVLTGSSARKLKRSGVDLLGGRALNLTLHPFMAAELGDAFDLDRALQYGTLPLVLAAPRPAEALKAYVALYLREEVQSEGLTRNIGGFARFMDVFSFSHASVLNISNVARECEIQRKTVEGYVSILEDLLLAYRVPVFSRRAVRSTAAHPKSYLFDCGVFRALRPAGPLDRAAEIEGAALEGLIVEHVRTWNACRDGSNQLYYWRTRSGVEVDLVLYGRDGLWAIEVKNSLRVDSDDVRSLRSFRQDYPESQCLLVYRGERRLEIGGILCVPCHEFLRQLHPARDTLFQP